MSTIITGYTPGLIGEIIRFHGQYYAREWDLNYLFEIGCTRRLHDIFSDWDVDKDRVWSSWDGEKIRGAIIIQGSAQELNPNEAWLRFYFVTDEARGTGLGKALLAEAMDYVKGHYETCILDTITGLEPAVSMYKSYGFEPVEYEEHDRLGGTINEMRMRWRRE